MSKSSIKAITAIALASLSITGLMLPASAATTSLTIPDSAVGEVNETRTGLSKTLAIKLAVPSEDKILPANSIAITMTGLTPATEVTAKATNAKLVSALHTEASPVRSGSGSETLNLSTGGGSTVTFHAYTTSTDFGTISVSYLGNSTTYHLQGIAGPAYNIELTAPTHMNLASSHILSAQVSDVFGNSFNQETSFNPATGFQTAVVGGASFGSFSWNSTTKKYEATLTARAVAGVMAVSAQVAATPISTLPAPKNVAIANIEVKDLGLEITTLKAQLEKATLDAAKAKTKFNKLAKRWNKNFPERKVSAIK